MVTPVRVAYADRVWKAGVRTGGQAAAVATQIPRNKRALSSSPPTPQDTVFPYAKKKELCQNANKTGFVRERSNEFSSDEDKRLPRMFLPRQHRLRHCTGMLIHDAL